MATTATVNVNFTKSQDQNGQMMYQFAFDPIRVATLTPGPAGTVYTVILQLTSNVPSAVLQFINRDVGSPLPAGFTASGHGTTTLTLMFTNTGGNHLDYSLTVFTSRMTFRSDDPEIEVPPPT